MLVESLHHGVTVNVCENRVGIYLNVPLVTVSQQEEDVLHIKLSIRLENLRKLGVHSWHTENGVVEVVCNSLVLVSIREIRLFLVFEEDEASAHIGVRTRDCLVVGQLVEFSKPFGVKDDAVVGRAELDRILIHYQVFL